LVSANGPSISTDLPPTVRMLVAAALGVRRPLATMAPAVESAWPNAP
jgi:hypothetical protein